MNIMKSNGLMIYFLIIQTILFISNIVIINGINILDIPVVDVIEQFGSEAEPVVDPIVDPVVGSDTDKYITILEPIDTSKDLTIIMIVITVLRFLIMLFSLIMLSKSRSIVIRGFIGLFLLLIFILNLTLNAYDTIFKGYNIYSQNIIMTCFTIDLINIVVFVGSLWSIN